MERDTSSSIFMNLNENDVSYIMKCGAYVLQLSMSSTDASVP